MRKIEEKMLQALSECKSTKVCQNTSVQVINSETKAVFLHGHEIARYACGRLYVSLCGWNSPTTRSRLRAIGVAITCKDYAPHIGGVPVSSYGIYEIDRASGSLVVA